MCLAEVLWSVNEVSINPIFQARVTFSLDGYCSVSRSVKHLDLAKIRARNTDSTSHLERACTFPDRI